MSDELWCHTSQEGSDLHLSTFDCTPRGSVATGRARGDVSGLAAALESLHPATVGESNSLLDLHYGDQLNGASVAGEGGRAVLSGVPVEWQSPRTANVRP